MTIHQHIQILLHTDSISNISDMHIGDTILSKRIVVFHYSLYIIHLYLQQS